MTPRTLRRPVLALGVLSVLLWLSSYSWVVGVVPPTRWISQDVSPWLIAEIAAAAVGALSLVAGLLLARHSARGARRVPICAAALGGFAMVMSILSIAMPV